MLQVQEHDLWIVVGQAGADVVGLPRASTAIGHDPVAENPMSYVLRVLGRHGGAADVDLRRGGQGTGECPRQVQCLGQVGDRHRQVDHIARHLRVRLDGEARQRREKPPVLVLPSRAHG